MNLYESEPHTLDEQIEVWENIRKQNIQPKKPYNKLYYLNHLKTLLMQGKSGVWWTQVQS